LQIEFVLLALGAVGYARKEVEAFPELRDGFGDRPSSNRLLTPYEQIADRLLNQGYLVPITR
jgi:hypothetical protein